MCGAEADRGWWLRKEDSGCVGMYGGLLFTYVVLESLPAPNFSIVGQHDYFKRLPSFPVGNLLIDFFLIEEVIDEQTEMFNAHEE